MTPAYWIAVMLAITGLTYAIASAAYQAGGRPGMALAFVGYVIANIGLVWDALSTAK